MPRCSRQPRLERVGRAGNRGEPVDRPNISVTVALPLELHRDTPRRLCGRADQGYDPWWRPRLVSALLGGSLGCILMGWAVFSLGAVLKPIGVALLVFGALLSPVALLLGSAVMVMLVSHALLVRYGQPAVAVITQKQPGDGFYDVRYTFMTWDGRPIARRADKDNPWWESQVGDHFVVVYCERWPTWHLIYSCSLFKTRL